MIVNHLPSADHIISIGHGGQVNEQGTFKELRLAGGYVQSLSLSTKISSQDTSNSDSEASGNMGSPTTHLTQPIEEDGRLIGDATVYKYYAKALGWSRMSLYLVFLIIYAVVNAVRCT